MTTVRELITKWVFKSDTAQVHKFESAIHASKSAALVAAKGLGVMAVAAGLASAPTGGHSIGEGRGAAALICGCEDGAAGAHFLPEAAPAAPSLLS
jgi:hypothetical protein